MLLIFFERCCAHFNNICFILLLHDHRVSGPVLLLIPAVESLCNPASLSSMGAVFFMTTAGRLVVEQSESCEAHGHSILITCINYVIVSYRTTRLSDILNAGLLCTFDVVAEWEERIGTKSNVLHAV